MEIQPNRELNWRAPLEKYNATIKTILASNDISVTEKRDEHLRFAYMDLLESVGVAADQSASTTARYLATYKTQYTFGEQITDLKLAPFKLLPTGIVPLERLDDRLLAAFFDVAARDIPVEHQVCSDNSVFDDLGDIQIGCEVTSVCPRAALKQLSLRLAQLLSVQYVFSYDDEIGGAQAMTNQNSLGALLDEYDIMFSEDFDEYVDRCDQTNTNAFKGLFMNDSDTNGEVTD